MTLRSWGAAKARLRGRLRHKRRCAHQERGRGAQGLARVGRGLVARLAARTGAIALYQARGDEIDPNPLARVLARSGRTLALPALATRKGAMAFVPWRYGERLRADAWGIAAPVRRRPCARVAAVFAPLLAWDSSGVRLGQGGGHYDKALARMRPRPLLVGVGWGIQRVGALPRERHDIRLDAAVCERGTAWFVGGRLGGIRRAPCGR